MVGDSVRDEFIGIVNYALIALIQCKKGYADTVDMSQEEALAEYDEQSQRAKALMDNKNHDYDEAWRHNFDEDIQDQADRVSQRSHLGV